MSAPLPISPPDVRVTRPGLLAAAGVVLATTSVAVTLAVSTAPPPGHPERPAFDRESNAGPRIPARG